VPLEATRTRVKAEVRAARRKPPVELEPDAEVDAEGEDAFGELDEIDFQLLQAIEDRRLSECENKLCEKMHIGAVMLRLSKLEVGHYYKRTFTSPGDLTEKGLDALEWHDSQIEEE
jgi:hypothetical protein